MYLAEQFANSISVVADSKNKECVDVIKHYKKSGHVDHATKTKKGLLILFTDGSLTDLSFIDDYLKIEVVFPEQSAGFITDFLKREDVDMTSVITGFAGEIAKKFIYDNKLNPTDAEIEDLKERLQTTLKAERWS